MARLLPKVKGPNALGFSSGEKNSRKRNTLVIAVHDVTPVFFPQLKQIVERLIQIGVTCFVLKVIPNFNGEADIRNDKVFLSWLHGRQNSGSEIVLHGWEHCRPRKETASIVRTCSGSPGRGEDEFACLSPAEIKRRVQAGLEVFQQAGLEAVGFTPPTWRLAPHGLKILKEAGLLYLTTWGQLIDLRKQRHFFSPAFGHQGISPLLEYLMVLGNRLGAALIAPCLPLVRVVFHPRRANHPNFENSLQLVRRLLPKAEVSTYAGFLSQE